MTSTIRLLLLVPALALAACSSTSYCEDQQDYERSGSVPPLKTGEEVKLPQSEAALKIPPRPESQVAYGEPYINAEGDSDVRCLDKPPEMPALPEEPKPAEPAPTAPAVMPPAEPPAEPKAESPPPG